MRIKILEKLYEYLTWTITNSVAAVMSLSSPELKPVVLEPEVILRFPDVDKLAPPILQLSEVVPATPSVN